MLDLNKLKSSAAEFAIEELFAEAPAPATPESKCNNPGVKSQEFKVTETFNGYKDAQVFGVVVVFEFDGREFGAYVDFPAGTTVGGELLEISDHETEEAVEFADETLVEKKVMEAAKKYVSDYYAEVVQNSIETFNAKQAAKKR
jgi:hypothetical protein